MTNRNVRKPFLTLQLVENFPPIENLHTYILMQSGEIQAGTRIWVQNIPKYYTVKQLRDHFSQFGQVTDAKIIYGKGGVVRRFGFIGYKTSTDAKNAVDTANGTYIDTAKIQVTMSHLKGTDDVKPIGKKKKVETNGDLDYIKSKRSNEVVEETGRVFVSNLPYTATEEEITELFREFGEITEVHIPIDRESKKSKGLAFVLFLIPECAKKSLQMDGSIFQGRVIQVLPGEAQPVKKKENDSTSYKSQLVEKKKQQAGNAINWNSLFFKSDTVVENISKQMGVNKKDLLDQNADNLAVRVALGEAELIKQTREELEQEGIDFDEKNARSKTMILIKNLPKGTEESELEELFKSYGSIKKVIVPKSGVLGLIEFTEHNEAKSAFRALAYRMFKHTPLYLEWAPVVRKKRKDEVVEIKETVEQDSNESGVLYVKNLNFATTKETLESVFENYGAIRKITVLTGFGFVEFENLKDAVRAHDGLKNHIIDNHKIVIQYSNIDKKDTKPINGGQVKLVVKNLPFEATKKDMYDLFSPFGKVKVVRIPEKVGGGHRGFAFIEFVSETDATNAMSSLKRSHLYGRHLVVEYASKDQVGDKKRKRDDE